MADMTVIRVCRGHYDGNVDATNSEHLKQVLNAEGDKRLEGFAFESSFTDALISCIQEEDISFGWFYVSNWDHEPTHWFKLVNESNPWRNAVDRPVADFLVGRGCQVACVNYDENKRSFQARSYDDGRWSEVLWLPDLLKKITAWDERKKNPRDYPEIDRARQNRIVKWLMNHSSLDYLRDLVVSRMFVNCYIYPWFGKQPMDIDACALIDKTPRFIEFKRKYPASDGDFGLDIIPHYQLARWLEERGSPLILLLLIDPLHNKAESPLHLVEESSTTVVHAHWLGTEVRSAICDENGYRTSGRDSGSGGGERRQVRIPREKFTVVGSGLNPSDLCSFLRDPRGGPMKTRDEMGQILEEAHEAAESEYGI